MTSLRFFRPAVVVATLFALSAAAHAGNFGGFSGNKSGGSSFNRSSASSSTRNLSSQFNGNSLASKLSNSTTISRNSLGNNSTPKFTTSKPITLGNLQTSTRNTSTVQKHLGNLSTIINKNPQVGVLTGRPTGGISNVSSSKVEPKFNIGGILNNHVNNNIKHNLPGIISGGGKTANLGNCTPNTGNCNTSKGNCFNWNWSSKFCGTPCYKPCIKWNCWTYPRWCPLYRHSCGYFVNVPAVVIHQGVDLQLLAVRFVDNGDGQQLGPRYRVWVRNNSLVAINSPFNVLLLAARDANPAADLPQAGVRIDAIAAGQVLPIDIRLPISANQPGLPMLHAVVDSHRQIGEVHEDNNGLVVNRGEIPLVDAVLLGSESQVAAPGSHLNIAGEGLSTQAGRAIVQLGGLQLEAAVVGWSEVGARVTLPALQLMQPTQAQLVLVRADGKATNPLAINLVPAAGVAAAGQFGQPFAQPGMPAGNAQPMQPGFAQPMQMPQAQMQHAPMQMPQGQVMPASFGGQPQMQMPAGQMPQMQAQPMQMPQMQMPQGQQFAPAGSAMQSQFGNGNSGMPEVAVPATSGSLPMQMPMQQPGNVPLMMQGVQQ